MALADPGLANGGQGSSCRRRRQGSAVGRGVSSAGFGESEFFFIFNLEMSTSSAFRALFFAVQLRVVHAKTLLLGS